MRRSARACSRRSRIQTLDIQNGLRISPPICMSISRGDSLRYGCGSMVRANVIGAEADKGAGSLSLSLVKGGRANEPCNT